MFDQRGKGLRIEGLCRTLRDLCGLNGRAVRHLNNLRMGALAMGSKRPAKCLPEWQSRNKTDTAGERLMSTLRCEERGLAVASGAMGGAYGAPLQPLQYLDLDLDEAGAGVTYGAERRS